MTLRYKKPDIKNAESIIEASKRDLDFTLTLKIDNSSIPTIIKNIYECFRMLGDALLVSQGKISKEHTEQIKALLKTTIATPRPLQLLDNFRMLRHNLNYYGYQPTQDEAEDVVDFAKQCFNILYEAVKKEIKK